MRIDRKVDILHEPNFVKLKKFFILLNIVTDNMNSQSQKKFIVGYKDVGKENTSKVGGKNANIGELLKIHVPVPNGFVITTDAYRIHLKENNIYEEIEKNLKNINNLTDVKLQKISKKIRKMIESAPLPKLIENEITIAYKEIMKNMRGEVAVRSSANVEDLAKMSFAGQFDTYLYVKNIRQVLQFVKKCFGSIFSPRAITHIKTESLDPKNVIMSVGIQRLINPLAAGTIFTIHPVTQNPDILIIEASWGIGEVVVQGKVNPDRYEISKKDLTIINKQISSKKKMIIKSKNGGMTKLIAVSKKFQRTSCLNDSQITQLSKYAKQIEIHYGKPMDIEWCLEKNTGKQYIVQARPVVM